MEPNVPAVLVRAARRIEIAVTEKGWEPDHVTVHKGEAVRFVFTRKTEKTCVKELILYIGEEDKVMRELPLNQPVEIVTAFRNAGTLGFTCGMTMKNGVITIQ